MPPGAVNEAKMRLPGRSRQMITFMETGTRRKG
jgi:hypothetical protein